MTTIIHRIFSFVIFFGIVAPLWFCVSLLLALWTIFNNLMWSNFIKIELSEETIALVMKSHENPLAQKIALAYVKFWAVIFTALRDLWSNLKNLLSVKF